MYIAHHLAYPVLQTVTRNLVGGASIQFVAEPADKFINWGGECQGTYAVCDVVISGKVQVFAYFEVTPPEPAYPSPVPKTGQINCYDNAHQNQTVDCANTGQDGDIQAGIAISRTQIH